MDVQTLVAAMPGLDRVTAARYLPYMEAAMREHGITTAPRSCMWLAQVGHESASLRYMEEIADGSAYEGRRDLGNVQAGDGRRFKGRGPIQLTGRANYKAAGDALRLDLVGQPALAAGPANAFRVSAWWWSTHGLNGFADREDVTGATRRINGGLNGLADRRARYVRCRALGGAVLPAAAGRGAATPSRAPALRVDYFSRDHNARAADVAVWQRRLRERGFQVAADGVFGPATEAVTRQFQARAGVAADGRVGPVTWVTAWA